MLKNKGWGYRPYKPPFFDSGDIYVCRVVPSETAIHLEWLPLNGAASYSVYCRVRGEDGFSKIGETAETQFDVTGLTTETDHEFFVESGEKKSRIRLARTGAAVGTVVNYLHPEDEAYGFSGRFLCSPSFVRHPDGYLLSSMDLFAGGRPQNLTLIFRSDDDGETWHYVTDIFPAFWGKLFIHRGEVYMLAVSTEFGDLLIGKSKDGMIWSDPVVLMHGGGGKNGQAGVHKNPEPIVEFAGRLWNTMEWGELPPDKLHAPMVFSAPVDADLLDPYSWTFSDPIEYDPSWPGVAKGPTGGNIEGCLTVIDGKLYNVMRYNLRPTNDPPYGLILSFKVDTENPGNPLTFDRAIEFPGGRCKFIIRYDTVTGKYFSLATRLTNEHMGGRRLLSLMVSDDCYGWRVVKDILDRRNESAARVGFQYADFFFEGEDLLFVCRTAINEPDSFHNSNYQTFHRIENFRDLLKDADPEIFHAPPLSMFE